VAGRPVGAAPLALPAQSPGGRYKVRYQVWLPRAMEVSYTLRCGGHEERGVLGETFEQYQVRRTAELQAERQRERERRAQVGSLIGGAVLGQAQAGAAVATPDATGAATVTVDGAAAGAAAGAATVTDAPIVLAPDDLGQGFRQGDLGFHLGDALEGGAPACAMELTPLDAAVDTSMLTGTYTVERWFDAKRAERVRVAGGVTTVRADLRARLIARGADPELAERKRAEAWARLQAEQAAEDERQRRLRAEEEARLAVVRAEEDARRAQEQAAAEARRVVEDARRAEAERVARLELEAQARVEMELELRLRAEVMSTREALYVYYGRCGGNRHHREELRQAEERRRGTLEMEARMRLEMSIEIRARLRTGLIAYGADPGLRDRLLAEAAQRAEREEAERRRRIAIAEEEARRRTAIEDEERRRRRAEREAELGRRAAEEEARAAADLVAWEAEQSERSRRISIVVGVRAQLTDSLLAMGARVRPPMPAPVDYRGHWKFDNRTVNREGDATVSPGTASGSEEINERYFPVSWRNRRTSTESSPRSSRSASTTAIASRTTRPRSTTRPWVARRVSRACSRASNSSSDT
jgi:hypothetical protein